jgi:two-component system KDP operon response regulator KdpE
VLVVDDEPSFLAVVAGGLRARGYEVRTACSGVAALDLAAEEVPDLVILDLGLPDLDGIDVCRQLRHWIRNPILVLTADGAEDRKVLALDEGADDYVTKPFSMPELLARVRVALRHRRLLARLVDDTVLVVGALRIDPGAHEVQVGDERLNLTPKEYALLELLTRNVGRVLTHKALLEQVWEPSQDLATLRTHVNQLRRKLGQGPSVPRLVTEPGVGYRLLTAVPLLA